MNLQIFGIVVEGLGDTIQCIRDGAYSTCKRTMYIGC